MDYAELSDLEEGEILEYDSTSPSDTAGAHFGIRNFSLEGLRKGGQNEYFGLKDNKNLYFGQENDGYPRQGLKEKLKLSEKLGGNKLSTSTIDLESISSDGEYRSDEEQKSSGGENRYLTWNAENRGRGALYGTVEDIMSEIGETICRKSRCNYKKRKSKEFKQSLDKCSATSYDLWRSELFFCRLKSKRRKRKGSLSDSNSDLPKERTERRKRRKRKKVFHYEEDKGMTKKSKVRDFDEVRRNLLEKLKKQKAEQESKDCAKDPPREGESGEIEEVDMLIDCTNYVDEARVGVARGSTEEETKEEEGEEKEDEMDLTKLRLIALASNRKRKAGEEMQKSESPESVAGEKKCLNGDRKDLDLDRNELLLRAEALKSALLKKHQKRLNRLKAKTPDGFVENNSVEVASPATEESPSEARLDGAKEEGLGSPRDPDGPKEEGDERGRTGAPSTPPSSPEEGGRKVKEAVHQPSSVNGKRCHPKARTKRKKSKSGSLGSGAKEKEKSEALEEDDRTLRCQLLKDLIKKKSLKNLEKNSVPVDLARTADGKASPSPPPPVANDEPPKDRPKPPPPVKATALRKINAGKAPKAAAVLKIPKPEIQRIIVHLGSEDSSDEEVASGGAGGLGEEAGPTREEEKEGRSGEEVRSSEASKEAGKTIRADYERSVELLLSQARKKIEGERQSAKGTLATPEAVYKHLPPSQRLEYIRLKQKIAERERLKMRIREGKKENSSAPLGPGPPATSDPRVKESAEGVSEKPKPGNLGKAEPTAATPSEGSPVVKSVDANSRTGNSTSICKAVGGVAGANGAKSKEANQRVASNKAKNNLVGFCGKGLKKSVAPPGNGLKTALPIQRSTLLLPSSQALISKLKLLLKKIKIEKMIEENYGKEISKLRAQLSLFERKQSEQRFKIKKLGEESMKTYKAIQGITAKANEKASRKENVEKEKEKEDRGEAKREESTKLQKEGKNVSDEPVPEITTGQGKSAKEENSADNISETRTNGTASAPCLLEYSSPLQMFNKVVDRSKRVDPNVVMCQFDLMGVCKDEECTYQHLRDS